MDISILLALQDFRNGPGDFLAGFLSKMTWLGELNTATATWRGRSLYGAASWACFSLFLIVFLLRMRGLL